MKTAPLQLLPCLIVAATWPGLLYAQGPGSSIQPIDNFLIPQDVPRSALVIGVEHYDKLDKVDNALNDARETAAALRRAGFASVRELPDATKEDIDSGVDELAQRVGGKAEPAIVVIFFAGHGFQEGAFNYLVPKKARSDHLLDDGVSVASVVEKLAPRRAGLSILFLDACRTLTPLNPPARAGQATVGGRIGFGQVAVFDGAVVGLAPGWNKPAFSKFYENDTNSPYTRGLTQFLNQDLSLDQLLGEVYRYVKIYTQDKQVPEQLVKARSDRFRFLPTMAEREAETRAWRATLETNRTDCVYGYVIDHPDSPYLKAAERWMAEHPLSGPNNGGVGCPAD